MVLTQYYNNASSAKKINFISKEDYVLMYSKHLFGDTMSWDEFYTQIRYHSGRTDSNFGHRDILNRSGLGAYHCHNRRSPHLHIDG